MDAASQPHQPEPGPAPAVREFPCQRCGARVEFVPGSTSLKCPYCAFENPIEQSLVPVEELDYSAHLAALADAEPTRQAERVKCSACAAEVDVPPNVVSLACPYCARPIVTEARACAVIKPRSLLPFRVTRDDAARMFREWVSRRWFAPNALKRDSSIDQTLSGLYMPAWTYDAHAHTRYAGQRGDAYYVPVTRRVGNRTTTTMERRIRWSSVSGEVSNRFDDLLVLATRSLPDDLVHTLEPWDLEALVPYTEDYLAGFRAESYQIDLGQGFVTAQQMMQPVIDSTIRADIGGDEQRITAKRSTYDRVTFKHLLLPVWVSAYRFRNKTYRFLVNARTGEVTGERPYSAWKITFAVLAGLVVATIIGLIINARQ
jgi:DNA-directed RNA polymerase subunit RPC12/RpoP